LRQINVTPYLAEPQYIFQGINPFNLFTCGKQVSLSQVSQHPDLFGGRSMQGHTTSIATKKAAMKRVSKGYTLE
jgi:hypothetical protein